MKVKDVTAFLEDRYPPQLAMEWDNPGLLVGDGEAEVHGIYTALDAADEVIDAALQAGCDLIVTHHPMIFSPLHAVTMQDFIGRRVLKLARNGISLFAMHTNYDIAGMADLNADLLRLRNAEVLEPAGLDENGVPCGIGRVGELEREMTLSELAAFVKEIAALENVRVYGDPEKRVKRAAVSSGSGKGSVPYALSAGADVLITGDVDYHSGIDAVMRGICVIDAGHYGTEFVFAEAVAEELQQAFSVPVYAAPVKQPYSIL